MESDTQRIWVAPTSILPTNTLVVDAATIGGSSVFRMPLLPYPTLVHFSAQGNFVT